MSTPQKPRYPERLWLYLRLTFQPLPDQPNHILPIQLAWHLHAHNAGDGFYTIDSADPLAWIEHEIILESGATNTTGTITADLATHAPYAINDLLDVIPAHWSPYRLELPIQQPSDPAPLAAPDYAIWHDRPPSKLLPAEIAATRKPTGPIRGKILERRQDGPRARAQALARPTPSPRQQLQQARFRLAQATWREWPAAHRTTWNHAAKQLRLGITGWNLFLSHVLDPDPDRFARLQAKTIYQLPPPPTQP